MAKKYLPAGMSFSKTSSSLEVFFSFSNEPATKNAPPLNVNSLNAFVQLPRCAGYCVPDI